MTLQLTAMNGLDSQLWSASKIAFTAKHKTERDRAKKRMLDLVKQGANKNSRQNGETLMHLFARIGNNKAELIERSDEERRAAFLIVLTDKNINAKDNKGWSPYRIASSLDKSMIASSLWDFGAEEDHGGTDLHKYAGPKCNVGLLEQSIKNSPEAINAKDDDGNTPLHYAHIWGQVEFTGSMLVLAGADINAKNKSGRTPLDCGK